MEHWSKAMAAVSKMGEVISRTAQSAQELLRDQELRSKGIQTVITGAQSRLQGIQNGIVIRAGRIGERLLDNRRQLQALLQSLEDRLNASQRAWQLQARRRDKVDVQFGRQVIENAPQEVRARLWYVLLENPHLAAPLQCENPGPGQSRLSDDEDDSAIDDISHQIGGSVSGRDASVAAITGSGSSSRLAAVAAAALAFARPGASVGSFTSSPSAASLPRRDRSNTGGGVAGADALEPREGSSRPSSAATTPQNNRASRAGTAMAGGLDPSADANGDSSDGWELVSGVLGATDASGLPGSGTSGNGAGSGQPEAVRLILERLDALGPLPLDESGSDPVLVAQQAVLEAMLQVPWESGVGLPASVAPDSRFAVLNEMTAGQEEVDDSILRDIHRTFPEHPYFSMEAGQHSLFRVLKAYSLHDLEVAYCQGMAFMVGVLLMYVPEETAFRLFCRLMDPEGPNLRRLYLPGLEPLKAELATFDLLLTWRLPDLGAHLTEFGLPPVLYVSQWLMTLFATPFPPAFCARIIDILLQDGHDRLLLRCSYAVIEALEKELLARHDFEALITYIKMEPVSWGLTRQRAIMERALASPLTDDEIDVARDTVANRQFLAAAAAAAATAGEAQAAGAATAAGELLGITMAASMGPALPGAVMQQRQLSFEHEVEAALALAAAAITAGSGRDGGGGAEAACSSGGAAAAASAVAGGTVTLAPSWERASRGSEGRDMISFEDRAGDAGGSGAAEAGPRSSRAVGAHGCGSGQGRGRELGSAEFAGLLRFAGKTTADGGSCGLGTVRQACDDASYGMSPSLLDELDFGCGAMGGVPSSSIPKAQELEYGEYGEMLIDAGFLLPELGASGAPGTSPPGADGFGLLGLGMGGELGGPQAYQPGAHPSASGATSSGARLQRQQQPASDLLLD